MVPTDFLLFTAHCDDGELWAGGTIAKLVESGKRVTLAIAHHDAVRRIEAETGAATLGCEVWFRENNLDLFEWVGSCLHEARPEALLTHPIGDPHFEHDEIGRVVSRVLTKSQQRKEYPRRWYWCDIYNSTSPPGLPIFIDISAYFDRKCSALACHRSQMSTDLIDMAQAMNALHGRRIRVNYAEAFYLFPLLGRWPRLRELP
jgi:LmbE family N-acetylglucosaminyl deacetylase